ncbi:MAG TPA: O-methyltransferase [Terracidiphilus sp.]|jgi:predicted O-methyltransferase YrrM|nr:O-methyltransferase [Terracidiphilus sp.]
MAKKPQTVWTEVDRYFGDLLLAPDPALDTALEANRKADLPAIDVTPLQGKFLELLVRMSGARRILEIGTLGGYSTIWLARALPENGSLISLELEPRHAEIARKNLKMAGLAQRVEIRVAPALKSLKKLVADGVDPFDLIFIDADKATYPDYLDWSLKLSRPGTVLLADNVVRDGAVVDPKCPDPNVQGVRRFTEKLAAESRLTSTVLQTVAGKGYDGFALAIVLH